MLISWTNPGKFFSFSVPLTVVYYDQILTEARLFDADSCESLQALLSGKGMWLNYFSGIHATFKNGSFALTNSCDKAPSSETGRGMSPNSVVEVSI